MTEQCAKQVHPDEVRCQIARDGGAIVTARIGYAVLFNKAFSDAQNARDCASELFLKSFDKPEDFGCDELSF